MYGYDNRVKMGMVEFSFAGWCAWRTLQKPEAAGVRPQHTRCLSFCAIMPAIWMHCQQGATHSENSYEKMRGQTGWSALAKECGMLRLMREKIRERDKQQHFVYSLGIFVAAFLVLPSLQLSGLVVFFTGLGKEIWDHYFGSGFCLYDMIANGLGIAAGWALCFGALQYAG